MLNPDSSTFEITEFNGANTLLDAYTVPASSGLASRNVRYQIGEALTRFGHSAVATLSDGAIVSMMNWRFIAVGAATSVLAYYAPAVGVRTLNLTGFTIQTIAAQAGAAGCSFATDNQRLYMAFYNASGLGANAGQVYGWNIGTDPLFAPPVLFTPSISETASGFITQGLHRFGFLLTTRNGYITMACPSTGGLNSFSPVSFTSTGGKNATINIPPTGTWPSYASSISIIMTTAVNLNQWYIVPGSTQNIGGAIPANVTISISDADLAATGADATPYLSLLTSTAGGPPFSLSMLFPCFSRMAYIGIDPAGFPTIWFSDPGNFQFITADQHAVYLDGREVPVTGTGLRSSAYIFTSNSTYSVEDNGDLPVTWASPQRVDGSIGTRAIKGVFANESAGFIWVGDVKGLYCFQGGMYPALPVSYYQTSDWKRINWNAPAAFEVVDDTNNKRVMVKAALDGATAANYQLTWDYTEGNTCDTVKYSIDQIADGNYAMGAMAIVETPATRHLEVYLAPASNGVLIRQNSGGEANPYRDVTTDGTSSAYSAYYETSLVPGLAGQRGTLQIFHGFHIRARGEGNLNLTVFALDHAFSANPAISPLALSTNPGIVPLVLVRMISEFETIAFSSTDIDAHFEVSYIAAYYVPAAPVR